jgi:hypothetical protein
MYLNYMYLNDASFYDLEFQKFHILLRNKAI